MTPVALRVLPALIVRAVWIHLRATPPVIAVIAIIAVIAVIIITALARIACASCAQ